MNVGLKGFTIGGAQISEKHAGFIINKGNASSKDILDLIIDKFNFYDKMITISDTMHRTIIINNLINKFAELDKVGTSIYEINDYLNSLINDNESIKIPGIITDSDSVTITNIHKSKGLEYKICYYAGLDEKFNTMDIKKRILLGYFFSSSENYEKYFLKAQKVRRKLTNEFLTALNSVDFIITPTTPQTAFPIELTEEEKQKNIESNYLNDLFVCPVNMAGLPGLSVPMGVDGKNLPIGMHLIGRHFDEQTIFDVGLFLEKNRD